MDNQKIQEYFCKFVKENSDVSVGIIAIETLMEVIRQQNAKTLRELDENLKEGIAAIKASKHPVTAINSGSELFLRFITYGTLDYTNNIEECKQIMLKKGKSFLQRLYQSKGKIANLASDFINDGSRILTHSRSRVVLQALIEAAKHKKQIEVYVTLSAPDDSGDVMCKELEANGIPCTVILDSSVGHIMERVDFVMVGAEGVVETGGIINKVGTFTMAVCAKEMKKPFYVLAESFKFTRLYPISQNNLPEEYKYQPWLKDSKKTNSGGYVDYTPPKYISLVFTDLGILTPSAISDELIRLYL